MLFGSWITLSGLIINRFSEARWLKAFRSWGFALGSLLLLVLACSPWLGASFGPLVWGTTGCFIAWWLFNGHRLHWWFVLGTLIAAFALAIGVLYLDIHFNTLSHMEWVAPVMQQGLLNLALALLQEVWKVSIMTMLAHVPLVALASVVVITFFLVYLLVIQPGSYRQFWQRNTAFKAAYAVCLFIAVIAFFLEDSGVFTPAVLMIYPISCFVWLICDLHRWHLNELSESDDPVTIEELQLQAIEADELAAIEEADELAAEEADQLAAAEAEAEETENGEKTAKAQPSVQRSTAMMATATMVSRLTGYGRTWACGFALGVSSVASAYFLSNNVPNMIFEFIAGGILSSVFLPVYISQKEKLGSKAAGAYASNLFSLGLLVLGVVSVLATIFAPQIIFTQTFMKKTSPEVVSYSVFFFRFFAIQILFYGVGGLLNSLLNAHREYFWPSVGPIFNNIVVMITMFAFPFISSWNRDFALIWLAVGTSLGVVAMFALQLPSLIRLKIPLRFQIDLKDPALKESLRLTLPVTIFVVVNLIVVSTQTAFALNVSSEGTSIIQYAWPWYQLPYGVIAVALSTALFTELSQAVANNRFDILRYNTRLGLRTTLFAILPLATIIVVLSTLLCGIYRAGEFTADDVTLVAQILAVWCLSLPFYAVHRFLYRVFSALRDLKGFIVIDTCGRALQIFLYGFLTMGYGIWGGWGLIGIPITDTLVLVLLSGAMLLLLYRKIGHFELTEIIRDGIKMLAAAIIPAILPALFIFGRFEDNKLMALLLAFGWAAFVLVCYMGICHLLKVPEVAMVGRIWRRLRRHLPFAQTDPAVQADDQDQTRVDETEGTRKDASSDSNTRKDDK
jgi:putative peptidoglycan lipid II flippase